MIVTSRLGNAVIWSVLVVGTVTVAAFSTVLQIQVVVFAVMLIVAFVLHTRRRVLVLAASLVPIIALVRRLLSGSAGYTESDPLVLLPVVLLLCGVLLGASNPAKIVGAGRWVFGAAIAIVINIVVTVALRTSFDVQSLYSALSLAVPVILIAGVVSQRVPDVWSSVERLMTPLAIFCGAYGVVQFLVLPSWDKAWMITSKLQSIGQPYPLAVRVFGASESPGPYSSFIGLAVVLFLCKAVMSRRPVRQFAWFVGCAALAIPLLLSGVRIALIAVLICAALLVVIRGRGVGRIVPLALVAVVGAALTRILGAVAGSSTILTTTRYTDFNSQSDGSLQSRLGLFSYLVNPFRYFIGNPTQGGLDNLTIDVLVSYGLIAAIGVTVLFVVVVLLALRNLTKRVGEVASIGAVFIAVMSISGNVFGSPFGILVGFVFAAVCAAHASRLRELSGSDNVGPALVGASVDSDSNVSRTSVLRRSPTSARSNPRYVRG